MLDSFPWWQYHPSPPPPLLPESIPVSFGPLPPASASSPRARCFCPEINDAVCAAPPFKWTCQEPEVVLLQAEPFPGGASLLCCASLLPSLVLPARGRLLGLVHVRFQALPFERQSVICPASLCRKGRQPHRSEQQVLRRQREPRPGASERRPDDLLHVQL